MTPFMALVSVTVRGLLGRRRLLLMLVLASIPVLLGALVQVRGGRADVERVLAILVVQTVMPIVALILGTASLGPEIEDGTVVYLLTKPIRRWRVALAKIVVAVSVTALLVVPVTIATGLLVGGVRPDALSTTIAYGVACLAGGAAYAAVFVALSAMTGRALVIGLVYILIWEGALGELLEGTRFLSIRQATLGIVAGLGGEVDSDSPIQIGVAAVVLTIAILGSLLLTSWRLSRFEVRAGD
jgi:ABC-2 type transport system permease protein